MENDKDKLKKTLTKWLFILGSVLVVSFFGFGVIRNASRPKPGQEVADLGREHVAIGTKVDYNSNPPTSGPHYADWMKPGIYKDPQDDGRLVHSLEHGYIIISYNCDFGRSQGEGVVATDTSLATESASLADVWAEDGTCKPLQDELTSIYRGLSLPRLILVPRPTLDSKIALTAWARIDKFDEVDEQRIKDFAKVLHNRGPEQTME